MTSLNLSPLKSTFSGKIITPSDSEYEQARSTFVKTGSPAVVLQPASAQDVAVAVTFAKENSLILSVRSGGHGGGGFGTNDDGVVIDLSSLKNIEMIDEAKHIVRIETGALWGEVAEFLEPHHVAISAGDTKSVGVGGLTLGGGIGWMVRQFGLALDSMVGAEVVTADGQILHCNAREHADLFWAIRGGGGNFGVVTYFEFEAQRVHQFFTGTFVFDVDNISGLLTLWRDYLRTAPENLSSTLMVLPMFAGNPPSVMVMNCVMSENESDARAILEPMTKLGTLKSSDIKQKKYAEVLEEAHKPEGVRVVSHNAFVKEFTDEIIEIMARNHGRETSPILMLRSLGGAMNRVPKEATAFAHRDSEIFMMCVGFVPETAPTDADMAITKIWKDLEFASCGVYINFMGATNVEEIKAAYPVDTYSRLAKIKNMYDPTDLFNQNYNIIPQ